MKAKEINHLSVGNWLYSNLTHKEFWVKPHDIDPIHESPENVSPIKLTEEWLIKFGFKELNGEITLEIAKYSNADLWFNKNSGQLRLVAGDGKYLTHDNLRYVHQLQNLYFALTGQELIIKS